jgi:ubiquitin C-terminal hydrolase
VSARFCRSSKEGHVQLFLCRDSVPEYRYVLFAVINHQGSLETGHYTALVKTRGEVCHVTLLFED